MDTVVDELTSNLDRLETKSTFSQSILSFVNHVFRFFNLSDEEISQAGIKLVKYYADRAEIYPINQEDSIEDVM